MTRRASHSPGGAEDFTLDEQPLEPAGLLLSARGELDIATVGVLRARVATALEAGVTRLVVDLRALAFLDSVAVAALLQARRGLGDDGRMAVVVAPNSYARLIFEVAGLRHCLDVFATLEDAFAHVGS